MTWYFNSEGAADGPHEDDAMAALVVSGRIQSDTLVWHVGAANWLALAKMSPDWWLPVKDVVIAPEDKPQPVAAAASPKGKVEGPLTTRNLVPNAPVTVAEKGKPAGFFRRLFGLGGKKGA